MRVAGECECVGREEADDDAEDESEHTVCCSVVQTSRPSWQTCATPRCTRGCALGASDSHTEETDADDDDDEDEDDEKSGTASDGGGVVEAADAEEVTSSSESFASRE